MSSNLLYLEVNSICLLLLLWIILTAGRNEDFQTRNVYFYREVSLTMVILLMDMLWVSVEGHAGRLFYIVNVVVNVLYFVMSSVICAGWVIFAMYLFNSRKISASRTKKALLFFPHVVVCLLAVTSPWTHFTFFIDSHNVYHRGQFIWITEIIICLYLFVTFLIILVHMANQMSARTRRNHLFALLSLTVLVFSSGLVMFLMHGFDTLWPLFSIMLFVVYTDIQMERITLDSLTGLSNRAFFDRRLADVTTGPRPEGKELYLYVMDVDFFKRINDTYGHLEGDEALRRTAEILRSVFSGEQTVLVRYGGDEFACLWYCESEREAEEQSEKVMDAFRERNMDPSSAFPINISVGFARFGANGIHNDIELINAAEEALGRVKMVSHRKMRRRR